MNTQIIEDALIGADIEGGRVCSVALNRGDWVLGVLDSDNWDRMLRLENHDPIRELTRSDVTPEMVEFVDGLFAGANIRIGE